MFKRILFKTVIDFAMEVFIKVLLEKAKSSKSKMVNKFIKALVEDKACLKEELLKKIK